MPGMTEFRDTMPSSLHLQGMVHASSREEAPQPLLFGAVLTQGIAALE